MRAAAASILFRSEGPFRNTGACSFASSCVCVSGSRTVAMLFTPSKCFLYPPKGAGQHGTCLAESVQSLNLVVIRTRQRILRGNHFDVVRHARREPASCQIEFFAREPQRVIGNVHLISCRLPFSESRFHLLRD